MSDSTRKHRNPIPTVDVIVRIALPAEAQRDGQTTGIVLVKRRNPPLGWALPGGFVDEGETLEAAAVREAKEEISLDVRLVEQFHSYSDPRRDPRQHTITTVFIADAEGTPVGADDAAEARVFALGHLPPQICFDHATIINDYERYLTSAGRTRPLHLPGEDTP